MDTTSPTQLVPIYIYIYLRVCVCLLLNKWTACSQEGLTHTYRILVRKCENRKTFGRPVINSSNNTTKRKCEDVKRISVIPNGGTTVSTHFPTCRSIFQQHIKTRVTCSHSKYKQNTYLVEWLSTFTIICH